MAGSKLPTYESNPIKDGSEDDYLMNVTADAEGSTSSFYQLVMQQEVPMILSITLCFLLLVIYLTLGRLFTKSTTLSQTTASARNNSQTRAASNTRSRGTSTR